jgi:hypothetical protein
VVSGENAAGAGPDAAQKDVKQSVPPGKYSGDASDNGQNNRGQTDVAGHRALLQCPMSLAVQQTDAKCWMPSDALQVSSCGAKSRRIVDAENSALISRACELRQENPHAWHSSCDIPFERNETFAAIPTYLPLSRRYTMTTLTIKDLTRTDDLDRAAMGAVRGGMYKGMPQYWMPAFSFTKDDFKFDATQMLSQSQNTVVNNGNNVAFSSGITANVHPTQNGTNNINFG